MTPSGILDIIVIIYYVPALLVALYVGFKHGFTRSAGWLNLIMLGLFRLVGSALSLASIYQPSKGVLTASYIFSSIGTVSLLGALLGLVGRANQSLGERAAAPRVARFVQLITVVAVVLALVGGTRAYSSDPDKADEGHDLTKAAVILLVVIYAVALLLCIWTCSHRASVPLSDRRLVYVSVISLPFVLVRLILAICSVFLWSNSTFSMVSDTDSAVVVRAIMGILMEFIVVALFLWAGCTVGRSAEREAQRAQKHAANGTYQAEYGLVHDPNFIHKIDSQHT